DGSKDATRSVLERLRQEQPDQIFTLFLEQNAGKAEAVRRGVLACIESGFGDTVGFIDADLATPLDQIELLAAPMRQNPGVVMAFGSRVKLLGRHVERSTKRFLLGRAFATVASAMLGLPVYDTQ